MNLKKLTIIGILFLGLFLPQPVLADCNCEGSMCIENDLPWPCEPADCHENGTHCGEPVFQKRASSGGRCQQSVALLNGGCCSGGCFDPQTQVETTCSSTSCDEKEIKDFEVGDEVSSYTPESGGETSSLVERVTEVTRSGYYRIKTKDGKEIKVTAEHPLYALKREKEPLSFWEYLKTESLVKKTVNYLVN